MAEAGDIIQEFKKAKPPEKALIIGAVLGVVAIAYYMYRKNASSSASGSMTGSSSGAAGSTSAPGLPTWPYGSQPVLNSSGTPVGVIGPPPPGTPPPSGSPPPPKQKKPPDQGPPPGSPPPVNQPPTSGGTPMPPVLAGGQANLGSWSSGQSFTTSPGGSVAPPPGSWQIDPNSGQYFQVPAVSALPQGGGPFGTRVLGHRMSRIAPSKEGQSYVAKVYAKRVKGG